MHGGFVALSMLLALPIVVVVGFFVVWAMKVKAGQAGGESEKTRAEEDRLIQELHQGLSRMESRIEALETIVLDSRRRQRGEQ